MIKIMGTYKEKLFIYYSLLKQKLSLNDLDKYRLYKQAKTINKDYL